MVRNGIPRVCFYFLMHRKEFIVVFSSAEWFGTECREFATNLVPRNGIPSCVLFRRRVRNRIMGVYFYFWSTERNSELFSLPRKVRNGIPKFSVPQNNQNSVGNNHFFYLFRLPRNYFFVGNFQPYSCLAYRYDNPMP